MGQIPRWLYPYQRFKAIGIGLITIRVVPETRVLQFREAEIVLGDYDENFFPTNSDRAPVSVVIGGPASGSRKWRIYPDKPVIHSSHELPYLYWSEICHDAWRSNSRMMFQNRPYGGIVLVRGLDVGDRVICKYEFVRSNFDVHFPSVMGPIKSTDSIVVDSRHSNLVVTTNTSCSPVIFRSHHNRSCSKIRGNTILFRFSYRFQKASPSAVRQRWRYRNHRSSLPSNIADDTLVIVIVCGWPLEYWLIHVNPGREPAKLSGQR